AVVGHDLGERHAVTGRLAQGLIEQDRAGNVLTQPWGGQQHLPVGAAVLLRALDADAVETLLDGGVGLVDRDDALARGDHGLGGFGKLFDAHSWTSCRERWETREYSPRVSVPPAGPRSAARDAARVDRHLRSRLVADIDARTVDRRRADDSVTLALGDATATLLVAPAGRDQRVDIDLAVLAQRFGRERVAALEPERRHRIGGAGHIDAGPGLELPVAERIRTSLRERTPVAGYRLDVAGGAVPAAEQAEIGRRAVVVDGVAHRQAHVVAAIGELGRVAERGIGGELDPLRCDLVLTGDAYIFACVCGSDPETQGNGR